MIKRDLLKEMENGIKIVRDSINEGLLKNDTDGAFKVIDKKLKEMVGINIDTINTVSFDTIKSMINSDFENNFDKYIALGMLLKFQGYLYGKLKDVGNQIFYYILSLQAFTEGFSLDDTLKENYKKDINEMVNEVNLYELSKEEENIVSKISSMI